MWEENRKIIDIVDEKTFQPGLRTGKKKPRLMKRGRVCLKGDLFEEGLVQRRDLDDKGLGQNKVLYSSSGVKLPMVNYHTGSPAFLVTGRQIFGYPPASGSRTALTRILPCRLFLDASLGALFSASCWSPLFPLCGELDCWYCR